MEKRRGEEWRSVEFFEVWNWIEESAATVVSWRRSHWVPTILYLGFKYWAEAHPWWASWQNNILRKASWKIIQKNCGSFFSNFSIFQPCSSKMAVHETIGLNSVITFLVLIHYYSNSPITYFLWFLPPFYLIALSLHSLVILLIVLSFKIKFY